MAAQVKLHLEGFRALRNDPRFVAVLQKQADRIQASAGSEFTTSVHTGGTRARVTVYPASFEGILAEARRGALSMAVGSG